MLQLNNIDVYYDKTRVLKQINMEVKQRRVVSLIGSNGSGKSTLLKTISGILKPNTGTIEYNNERIDTLSPKAIVGKGIARVPEGKHLFPKMTVAENLKMGAYLDKDKRNVAANMEKCYKYFPILAERRKQLAGTLSGGEQQMVAMARGLMTQPKLFLIDEPSLGLAPKIVMTIAEIIYEIFHDGVTIILVEQNARMALSLSHYVYVMESGRITLEGTGKDLLDNEHVKNAYLGIKTK